MTIGKLASGFVIAVFASLALQAAARAQEPFPSRPVKLIVPFTAGGAIDVLARLIGPQLATRMGQPFVVENRIGAGGTIGADAVAKAAPDGYTLLFSAQGPLVMNPFLMKSLPYDAQTAFAPVAVVAEAPNVLAVNPSFPVQSLPELIAYGKSNPDKMMFATQGIGTTGHVTGAVIHQKMGLLLTAVPYQGFSGMYTDVVSGRVNLMIADTINVVPRIRTRELKAIAVASEKRSSALPDVPTFAESGYPDVVSGPWFSIVAPAGTPIDLRRRLASEVQEILRMPHVVAKMKDLGVESRGLGPDEFDAFLRAEYKKWGGVIRAAGITAKH